MLLTTGVLMSLVSFRLGDMVEGVMLLISPRCKNEVHISQVDHRPHTSACCAA